MLRVFLEAANHPNNPLQHLNLEMKWGITFSRHEISELEKLSRIMGPMETIFSKLNSEKVSTIHLVYPTVKVTLFSMIYFDILVVTQCSGCTEDFGASAPG